MNASVCWSVSEIAVRTDHLTKVREELPQGQNLQSLRDENISHKWCCGILNLILSDLRLRELVLREAV